MVTPNFLPISARSTSAMWLCAVPWYTSPTPRTAATCTLCGMLSSVEVGGSSAGTWTLRILVVARSMVPRLEGEDCFTLFCLICTLLPLIVLLCVCGIWVTQTENFHFMRLLWVILIKFFCITSVNPSLQASTEIITDPPHAVFIWNTWPMAASHSSFSGLHWVAEVLISYPPPPPPHPLLHSRNT